MAEPDPPSDPEPRDDDLHQTVELVQRAKGGDRTAFDALIGRYQERVHRLVRSRMGGELRREADSLDMVQEAMVDVCQGFERFEMRSEHAFVGWLATVVENRLREQVRFHRAGKRETRRRVSLEAAEPDESTPAFDPADSGESPSQEVGRLELSERLRTAVERLPEAQRRAIELRNAGLSWAAVAERLELKSADAARMLHARARVTLMKALPPEGT